MEINELPFLLVIIPALILGFFLPFAFPLIFKDYIKSLKWRLKEAKDVGY